MEKTKKLIVVIENQITQYLIVQNALIEANYLVYPCTKNCDIKEYKHFTDLARIYLNPRYGPLPNEKREKAFEEFINIINNIRPVPSALIIDHILLGFHNALHGIDLAIRLRNNGIYYPIMFLSRTQPNNIEIIKRLPNVIEPKEWFFKGKYGDANLDQDYVKNTLIPKFDNFIMTNINYSYAEKVKNIKKKKEYLYDAREYNIFEWLDYVIKNDKYLTSTIKELIDAECLKEEPNKKERDEFCSAIYKEMKENNIIKIK